MNIEDLSLPGVKLITPRVFGDDRGFFMETFKQSVLAEAGIDVDFVQDNHSRSSETGTVRGLHYQAPPFAQSKLVRVVRGSILDVAVDARRGSPHYGQSVAVELSAANFQQLFVPQGFLHGFITLEPDTEVVYKVDNYYSAAHDGSVRWDDPALGIDWGEAAASPVLSAKDQAAPLFGEFDNPFEYVPASEIA